MNEIQEVIRETDNTINSTKEILYNMKTLRVLGELKREIEELAPCIDCETEYNYLTTNAEVNLCQKVIKIINEKIENL